MCICVLWSWWRSEHLWVGAFFSMPVLGIMFSHQPCWQAPSPPPLLSSVPSIAFLGMSLLTAHIRQVLCCWAIALADVAQAGLAPVLQPRTTLTFRSFCCWVPLLPSKIPTWVSGATQPKFFLCYIKDWIWGLIHTMQVHCHPVLLCRFFRSELFCFPIWSHVAQAGHELSILLPLMPCWWPFLRFNVDTVEHTS